MGSMIKVFLVIVVGILAILVVRMMFSAKLEEEKQPAHSKKHIKRKKRKSRTTDKTVDDEKSNSTHWKKQALEQWQPGQPVKGCPNLRNEFHQCSAYCWQRYSQRPPEVVAMDR